MLLVTTLLRLALAAVALLPAQMLHAAAPTTTKLNRLLQEDSPYLRQHASNPVDWYPWGREAFEKGLFRDLCGWAVFRSCAAPTRCCGIG
jgi:hypothetical protein